MDDVLEIIKILIPTGVIFFVVYYTLQKFFDRERQREELEIRKSNFKSIKPIKIQAYERLILLLERINPESLVLRTNAEILSAKLLQQKLTQEVRSEFEHNLTQQLQVSNEAWLLVQQAKEEIIQLINMSATKVNMETASGVELATIIIQIAAKLPENPIQKPILFLKKEFQEGVGAM